MTTFTRTWDETDPANADQAKFGAQEIRELKEDIRERGEVDHSWAGDASDGAHKKVTLIEQGSDPSAVANQGFFYTKDVSGVTEAFYRDSSGNISQLTNQGEVLSLPRNSKVGFNVSVTAGADTDHDIDITAGQALDSTNAFLLSTTSSLTKQIDAVFAEGTGAGGFYNGTGPAADTWYHIFAIRKTSDGSTDVYFDVSSSAANIPSGWVAYRRIGVFLTDGSSNLSLVCKLPSPGEEVYLQGPRVIFSSPGAWNAWTTVDDALLNTVMPDFVILYAESGARVGAGSTGLVLMQARKTGSGLSVSVAPRISNAIVISTPPSGSLAMPYDTGIARVELDSSYDFDYYATDSGVAARAGVLHIVGYGMKS